MQIPAMNPGALQMAVLGAKGGVEVVKTVEADFTTMTWQSRRMRIDNRHAELAHDTWGALAASSERCEYLARVRLEYGQADVAVMTELVEAPSHTLQLSLADVYAILSQVTKALHHLHTFRTPSEPVEGIVHGSIFVLGGFESTRMLNCGRDAYGQLLPSLAPPLSKESMCYRAPEQWLGHPPSHASDCWALGVSLLELLYGQALSIAPSEATRIKLSHGSTPMLQGQVVHEMREKAVEKLRMLRSSNLGPAAEPLLAICNGLLQGSVVERLSMGAPMEEQLALAYQKLAQQGHLRQASFHAQLPEIKPAKPPQSPRKPAQQPVEPPHVRMAREMGASGQILGPKSVYGGFTPGRMQGSSDAFDLQSLLREVKSFLPAEISNSPYGPAPGLEFIARKAAFSDVGALYDGSLPMPGASPRTKR